MSRATFTLTREIQKLHCTSVLLVVRELISTSLDVASSTYVFFDIAAVRKTPVASETAEIPMQHSGVYMVDVLCGTRADGWPGVNHVARGFFTPGGSIQDPDPLNACVSILFTPMMTPELSRERDAVVAAAKDLFEHQVRMIAKSANEWYDVVRKMPVSRSLGKDTQIASFAHLYRVLGVDARSPIDFFFDRLPAMTDADLWNHLERAAMMVTETTLAPDGTPWGTTASWRDALWLHRFLAAYCHSVSYLSDVTVGMEDRDDMFEMACLNRSGDCEDFTAQVCALSVFIQQTALPATASSTLKRLVVAARAYEVFVALVTIEGSGAEHMVHIVPILLRIPGEPGVHSEYPRSLLAEATNMHSPADMSREIRERVSTTYLEECDKLARTLALCDSAITEIYHSKTPLSRSVDTTVLFGQKLGRNNGEEGWYHCALEIIGRDAQRLVTAGKSMGMSLVDILNDDDPYALVRSFPSRNARTPQVSRAPISQIAYEPTSPLYANFTRMAGISPAEISAADRVIASLPRTLPRKENGHFLTIKCGFWNLCCNLDHFRNTLSKIQERRLAVACSVHDVDVIPSTPEQVPSERVRVVSFFVELPRDTAPLTAPETYLRGLQSSSLYPAPTTSDRRVQMAQYSAGFRADTTHGSGGGVLASDRPRGGLMQRFLEKGHTEGKQPSLGVARESPAVSTPDEQDLLPHTWDFPEAAPLTVRDWDLMIARKFDDQGSVNPGVTELRCAFSEVVDSALEIFPPGEVAARLLEFTDKLVREEFHFPAGSEGEKTRTKSAKYMDDDLRHETHSGRKRLEGDDLEELHRRLHGIIIRAETRTTREQSNQESRGSSARVPASTATKEVTEEDMDRIVNDLHAQRTSIAKVMARVFQRISESLPFATPEWWKIHHSDVLLAITAMDKVLLPGGTIARAVEALRTVSAKFIASGSVAAATLVYAAGYLQGTRLTRAGGGEIDRTLWLIQVARVYRRTVPLPAPELEKLTMAIHTIEKMEFIVTPSEPVKKLVTTANKLVKRSESPPISELSEKVFAHLSAHTPYSALIVLDTVYAAAGVTTSPITNPGVKHVARAIIASLASVKFHPEWIPVVRILEGEARAADSIPERSHKQHGKREGVVPHMANVGARGGASRDYMEEMEDTEEHGAESQDVPATSAGGKEGAKDEPASSPSASAAAGTEAYPVPTAEEAKDVGGWTVRLVAFGHKIGETAEKLRTKLVAFWGNVKARVSAGWTALKSFCTNISLGKIATKIKDFFKNLDFTKIKEFLTHLLSSIVEFVKNAWANIKEAYKEVKEDIIAFYKNYSENEQYLSENNVYGARVCRD